MVNRIIGRHEGNANGPLLVVLGGVHGNEPAGVRALTMMFKMLDVEPITNPDFTYKGTILGLIGNLQAYVLQQRFIKQDLNRIWTDDNVDRIMSTDRDLVQHEDKELRDILSLIRSELNSKSYTRLILLDLHTTSSYGGIFCLPTEDEESVKIALELHAPVISGLLSGIKGTTLHYFTTDNMGIETVALTFESGQHNEELSTNRAIAAITNCMRTIGAINADHVENRHDSLLIEYSRNLPRISSLYSRHEIKPGDNFKMLPDYKNFQLVEKGQQIAEDKNGPIYAPEDALILMPLYQEKGEDGFFLIKKIDGY